MRPIKHILVVVDPTAEVQHCVEKGALLARSFGAVLELLVCDYQSGQLLSRRLPADVVKAAMNDRGAQLNKQLQKLAEPLRKAGLQVLTGISFQEHLHSGVLSRVRTSGADLVVKDTHYHGPIRRALFTITDWDLIRECPVPLLLVKPVPWHTQIRIAAAVDPGHADDKPSILDRELLDMTESLATTMPGEALVVHAFETLPLVAESAAVANGIGGMPCIDIELLDALRQYHSNEFKSLLAGRGAFEGKGTLIEGSAVTELPSFAARNQIDVLVAGAVSRSPLRRLLVGSTAQRLLDRLPCDILIVKVQEIAAESN
jgi:universal stress protein E